jgi:hypothetical protein
MQPVDAPAPDVDPALFDSIRQNFERDGAAKAVERLCESLREKKEYAKLFYALLMKKRVAMGVSPLPTAPSSELTPAQQEEYETAIREAARTVGGLFLKEGNIAGAFDYFRMIGEREPIADAIARYAPPEDADVQPIIEIAFHHGMNPKKGFDLVLDRYGICSAITFASGGFDPSLPAEVKQHCIGRLVRSLHQQLIERLSAEVGRQQGFEPSAKSIPELINGRDWLFADDTYYTDTSHLSSVVQMSVELEPGDDMRLARELCAYGQKLGPSLQYPGNPPFENLYRDADAYLGVLLDENVDAGIAHFRAKIEADPDGPETYTAAMLVKLLVRINRQREALEVARKYLAQEDSRQLPCPGPMDLAMQLGDYQAFSDVAKDRNDPVHFLAGMIVGRPKK